MRTMYAIYPHDVAQQIVVLREEVNERLVVMEEYNELVRKCCGNFDEKIAISIGLRPNKRIRSKRAIVPSWDNFMLFDDHACEVFTSLLPNDIDYFPIPSSRYSVASPKVWITPHEGNPGIRVGSPRCPICGRIGELVWGAKPFVFEGAQDFACINLESRIGARPTWLISERIAKELKNATALMKCIFLDPTLINDAIGESVFFQ